MKNLIFVILIFLMGKVFAQPPADNTAIKEKMKPFQSWIGTWKGKGSALMPNGEMNTSDVDERIEAKLDNTAILVEGLGKVKDMVVHQALGVLTFDQTSGQYKFKTWLRDGKTADAWFNVITENNYQWGFDSPMGKVRYTIVIDPTNNTWTETGEFSRDNTQWRKVFEMKLNRVQ